MTESNGSTPVEEFWQKFLARHPELVPRPTAYLSWAFGDSPEMADRLGKLVLDGVKTATSSLLWAYAPPADPLPAEGQFSIVLDGSGRPLCVVRTIEVRILAFDEVDEAFAWEEGEGDRSLAYWRREHAEFFARACPAGRTLDGRTPVVCERFRRVSE